VRGSPVIFLRFSIGRVVAMSASRHSWMVAISLSVLPYAGGCGGGEQQELVTGSEDAQKALPGGPPGRPGAAAKSSPELKAIMVKLAKGPNSLTPVIGKALKVDAPAWETIQGQTKEYAQLAVDMAKYDPPKGSKESWIKLTSEYASAAVDLDKAAQAKDKDDATTAHGILANSCNGCHRAHRMMGPGGGMMGGPGGMMRGPGGPGGPGAYPGGPGGPPGGAGGPGGGFGGPGGLPGGGGPGGPSPAGPGAGGPASGGQPPK
jgi:hypothetical protein